MERLRVQKSSDNNSYHHALLLLLLPPPAAPLQLHETETFLDFIQTGFYTGDWTLLKLLEGGKHGLWLGLQRMVPYPHCRTSLPGSCSLYHRRDGERSGICHLNWKVNALLWLHTRKPPLYWPLNLNKVTRHWNTAGELQLSTGALANSNSCSRKRVSTSLPLSIFCMSTSNWGNLIHTQNVR